MSRAKGIGLRAKGIRKNLYIVFGFSLIPCPLAFGPAALAAGNPGTTAAPILQVPIGSRPLGMGGAYAGVADDLYALYYNPAGLGFLKKNEASGMFLKNLDDTYQAFFGYGQPLPFAGLSGNWEAAAGAGIVISQNGKIEVNRTNPDGTLASSEELTAGQDVVLTVGYAEGLGETELEGTRNKTVSHYLGGNLKYVRSTLAETFHAQTFALDGGYLIELSDPKIRLGLSVQNLGGKLKFIEEGDPLPLIYRLGASYHYSGWEHHFVFSAEMDRLVYEKTWLPSLGAEYRHQNQFSFRAGYQIARDLAGLTLGFGIHHQELNLDYAWAPYQDISDTHRITLTYRFGKEKQQKTRESLEKPQVRDIDLTPKEETPPSKEKFPAPLIIPGWE